MLPATPECQAHVPEQKFAMLAICCLHLKAWDPKPISTVKQNGAHIGYPFIPEKSIIFQIKPIRYENRS